MMEELLTSLPSDRAFRKLIVSTLREEHLDSDEKGKLKRDYEMLKCHRQFERGYKGNDLMGTLEKFTSEELKSMVNDADHDKPTLLHYAARHGWKEILKTLITAYNFDPMCKDMNGQTAAHYAAKGKQFDVFEVIINEYQCDPMCKDYRSRTPLYFAVESGCLDIVKYYMVSHYNHNGNMSFNERPLATIAADRGHLYMLKYLVTKCNCDVKVFDLKCKTPLHYAAQRGYMDMVIFLIHECKCDPNVCGGRHGHSFWSFLSCRKCKYPLHFAAEHGHIDVVKFLLSRKCKADCTTSDEITPLHLAAENGHESIVELLISKYNCNVSCATNEGLNPLHYACGESGCFNIVEYLISRQGDAAGIKQTKGGLIPLHYASKYGHYNIVKFLVSKCQCVAHRPPNALEHGTNDLVKCVAHNTTNNGFTPLHFASKHGHRDLVEFLVSKCQCDAHCTANDGFTTPLYCASEGGHFSIVEFLIQHDGPVQSLDRCFEVSVENKHADIANYLIKKYNIQPITVLIKAICEGNYDQVEFLVRDCNVDPSQKDELGKTPLHYAVEHVHLKIIECLVFTGLVDLEAKDNNNKTPSQLADRSDHKKEISELFQTLDKAKKYFPVHSYVNVFFLGNSGAGKSTLCQVIIDTANIPFSILSLGQVKDVKPFTAGIIPTKLKHKRLGNIIIHDLAGHSEYYASHTAIIENILKTSNVIFVIVVDANEKEVMTHLQQWLMVVTNESEKAASECKTLVVVSHIDLVHNSNDLLKKMHEMLDGKDIPCHDLDCRRLGGRKMNSFFDKMYDFCKSIRTDSTKKPLNYYCHMMYSLLSESEKDVFSLSGLVKAVANSDKDRFILPYNDGKEIHKILSSLHSTGLIYYINEEDDKEVWTYNSSDNTFWFKRDRLIWVVINKQALFTEVNGKLFAPEDFPEHSNITKNGIVSVSAFQSVFPDLDRAMLVCFLLDSKLCNIMPYPFLQCTNLKYQDNDPADSFRLFFPSLVKQETPDEVVSKEKYVFGWCLQCKGPHQFFPSHFFHYLSLQLAYKYAVAEHGCIKSNDLQCCFWKSGIHWFNGRGVGTLVEVVNEKQCVVVMMSCDEECKNKMVSLRRKVIRDVIKCQEKKCPSFTVKASVIDQESLQYPINSLADRILYSVENIILALNAGQTHVVGSTLNSSRRCHKAIKTILPNINEDLNEPSKISILGNDEEDDSTDDSSNSSSKDDDGPLDITHLVDILDALKIINFPKNTWKELGLNLGLYHNTLDEIATNCFHNCAECLRETIAAWLKGNDSVLRRRSRTWTSLANALNKMGEKAAARQLQNMQSKQ